MITGISCNLSYWLWVIDVFSTHGKTSITQSQCLSNIFQPQTSSRVKKGPPHSKSWYVSQMCSCLNNDCDLVKISK